MTYLIKTIVVGPRSKQVEKLQAEGWEVIETVRYEVWNPNRKVTLIKANSYDKFTA